MTLLDAGVPVPADVPHAAPYAAWTALSLALPHLHDRGDAGMDVLRRGVAAAPTLQAAALERLSTEEARLLALDVLMVEAFARCRGVDLGPVADRLAHDAEAAARRLGVPPVLSYPLYIRANPKELPGTRRFTPTAEEFRFIRMHRLIEDQLELLISGLDEALDRPDPADALTATGGFPDTMRLVNRTVAAFRSESRMARDVFVHGFRRYFDPVRAEDGGVRLEGPSGLQSPTFRVLAMMLGYSDDILDHWTRAISVYHEPDTKRWLEDTMAARDAGRSLRALDSAWFGGPALPGLHPDYGREAPGLLAAALGRGLVSRDIAATLEGHGVVLGEWPEGAPRPEALPPMVPPGGKTAEAAAGAGAGAIESAAPAADARTPGAVGPPMPADDARAPRGGESAMRAAAVLETGMFAFHLEHVATTAHQIGYQQGTGGTSGVEFLLLATFRRGLPKLWRSGVGAHLADADVQLAAEDAA